jgi:hypothetical protein
MGARLCPPVPSATARTGLGSSGSVSVFRIRKTPKAPRISSGTRDSNPYDSRHETSPKPARSTEKQAPTPSGGVANAATIADGSQRSQLEPSDADLERAIVAAMLDGRGAVAELLAERLMRTSAHACGCGPPRTSRVPRRAAGRKVPVAMVATRGGGARGKRFRRSGPERARRRPLLGSPHPDPLSETGCAAGWPTVVLRTGNVLKMPCTAR